VHGPQLIETRHCEGLESIGIRPQKLSDAVNGISCPLPNWSLTALLRRAPKLGGVPSGARRGGSLRGHAKVLGSGTTPALRATPPNLGGEFKS
jgi:hypothetical protein